MPPKIEMLIAFPYKIGPCREAVEYLARLMGFEGELPEVLRVRDGLVLVRGRSEYYLATKKPGDFWRCSCKSAIYRPGKPCRHIKALGAALKPARPQALPVDMGAYEKESSSWDANGNIKQVGSWPGGRNGPVLEEVA